MLELSSAGGKQENSKGRASLKIAFWEILSRIHKRELIMDKKVVSCRRVLEEEPNQSIKLFPVEKEGKFGYIDKQGKYVWEPTK